MSEQEIKEKIKELQDEVKACKGTPCSVYSRVVGYLRPVQSFNDGKIEEYRMRKLYNAGNGDKENVEANVKHERVMEEMSSVKQFRQCCTN